MSQDIKTLLNQVLGECGFVTQSAFFASTDPAVLQLCYIANATARTIRKYQWQYLVKTGTINLTTGTLTYALATDFYALVPDTMYRVGNYYPVDIPARHDYWAQLKSAGAVGFVYECRIMGNLLNVINPTTGDSLRYEYFSTNPVIRASGSTPSDTFAADGDTWQLDDELFVRDVKWRFKREKGFDDWQVDLEDFKSYAAYKRGVDSGAQTVHFSRPSYSPNEPQTVIQTSDYRG